MMSFPALFVATILICSVASATADCQSCKDNLATSVCLNLLKAGKLGVCCDEVVVHNDSLIIAGGYPGATVDIGPKDRIINVPALPFTHTIGSIAITVPTEATVHVAGVLHTGKYQPTTDERNHAYLTFWFDMDDSHPEGFPGAMYHLYLGQLTYWVPVYHGFVFKIPAGTHVLKWRVAAGYQPVDFFMNGIGMTAAVHLQR
eukprot:TRINITY_DN13560_c0_g1_i1.p1 TRINITY_DN13560_c0_g1~~TRINITY_DN13560_c0_g1_i1.p1  ORF type:complete len:202 (-),score=26.77 TRINITY_DN13560_c0_g1_i1:131-736(-)